MKLLVLRSDMAHPAVRLLRRHRDASVQIRPVAMPGGVASEHLASGPPEFLDAYRACLERALRGRCTPPRTLDGEPGQTLLLHGPCTCNGRTRACGSLLDLTQRLYSAVPQGCLLTSAVLRGDGCTTVAVTYGEALPGLEHAGFEVVGTRALRARRQGLAAAAPAYLRVLLVAWEMGYYETPRRCTLDDLARRLGVAKSLVCRRLQSMEHHAIGHLLDGAARVGEHVDRGAMSSPP